MYDYEHTQPGNFIRVILLIVGFAVGVPLVATGSIAIALPMLGVTAAIFILFHSLTVRVSRNEIVVAFGIGLIRKSFVVDEIESARIAQSHWYNGWGIRMIRGGWLYNVSGFDAVEILLKNGRRYLIGTDEPQALLAAIETAMNTSARPSTR